MKIDARKRAIPVFTLIAILIGIGVVIQLWLLGASLEAILTHEGEVVLPATIASALLLAMHAALLAYMLNVDRRARDEERFRD